MTKKNLLSPTEENVVLFNDDTIRREWYNDERYYSVVDIVAVLSQSSQPSRYWTDLKNRLIKDEGFSEVFAKCEKLKFKGLDGKMYSGDATGEEVLTDFNRLTNKQKALKKVLKESKK